MTTKRLRAADRYAQLLAMGVRLAADEGFDSITQRRLGYECGISGPTVQHHAESMDDFRRAVFLEAKRARNLRALGRAVMAGFLVEEPLRSEGLRAALDAPA